MFTGGRVLSQDGVLAVMKKTMLSLIAALHVPDRRTFVVYE